MNDLVRRYPGRRGRVPVADALLRDNRVWVTCQTDDDIGYLVRYAGEDNLMIGTDYGHTDQSSEIEALRIFQEQGQVPSAVARKILDDNPRVLYHI